MDVVDDEVDDVLDNDVVVDDVLVVVDVVVVEVSSKEQWW